MKGEGKGGKGAAGGGGAAESYARQVRWPTQGRSVRWPSGLRRARARQGPYTLCSTELLLLTYYRGPGYWVRRISLLGNRMGSS